MAKGDQYQLAPWTTGPRKTRTKLNVTKDALQDALDRVLALEKEAGGGSVLVVLCVAGVPTTFRLNGSAVGRAQDV